MAASLPPAVRLKLSQALGQWRQWQCPLAGPAEVVEVLGGSHSNWNVLVGAAGARFVVRIDGVDPIANGINRHHEWRLLRTVAAAGLGPAPRYFNPDLGVLVCDYLAPDADQPVDLKDLGALLRQVHRLPRGHQRLDVAARLAAYETQLQRHNPSGLTRLQAYREPVLAALQQCRMPVALQVLCHNDLLRANRHYSGGKLYALDWEYAAVASPWHELATIIVGDDLHPDQAEQLLLSYLERPASDLERQHLRRHALVYGYLELAWYLAQGRHSWEDSTIAARVERLSRLVQ